MRFGGRVWPQDHWLPPAALTGPGSPLPGSTATFSWNSGSGVLEYWLTIGSQPDTADFYGASQGTNRSVEVTGLPTDGRVLYVTL